jgi:hypothetical protein
VPDVVLDYHRLKVPIDHPDLSVTRAKLEYPTVDVAFSYLASIGKTKGAPHDSANRYGVVTITSNSFADKAVDAWIWDKYGEIKARYGDYNNWYKVHLDSGLSTADFQMSKKVAGAFTTLGSEAVDITTQYAFLLRLSISGSALKGYRATPTGLADSADAGATPKISVTDTSIASGYWGITSHIYGGGHSDANIAWLRAPSSPVLPAQSIVEADLEGSGKPEDPFRPSLSKNLVEISSLIGLPDFLYQEAKKYEVLVKKGFTEDEIKLLLGYVPQHQVDLDSVTWGVFEFYPDKAPTAIVTIMDDSPYKPCAIEGQEQKARRFFKPKDYGEAVRLYNQLRKDYPHWLAGKDSLAYQVLGTEELEPFAVADFYYGELVEHRTHYDQLKQVPDWEMAGILGMWLGRLTKATVLAEEREKHIEKLRAVLKRGW